MQLALALSPAQEVAREPASFEASLRQAFAELDISRRLSFEQAMAERSFAIGIRNIAEAHQRRIVAEAHRRRCRRAAR
jgi:hypothetical protein